MTNPKTLIYEFGSEKTARQIEDIQDMQEANSNSSQVSLHNQVAATSANGLSRFIPDIEAKKPPLTLQCI